MLFVTLLLAVLGAADDVDFADNLARNGFDDLAREIYRECLKDPSPRVQMAAQYGLLEKKTSAAIHELLKAWPQEDPKRGAVEYDYAEALFKEKKYGPMRDYLRKEFLWEHDMTRLGLAGHLLLARAAADEGKWDEAFSEFELARHPEAPEATARSVYFEMRARMDHREPKAAVDLAKKFLRRHRSLAVGNLGTAIRLEAALARHQAGASKEAEKELTKIAAAHKDSWAFQVAMEYLDRVLGDTRPGYLVERGDWFFERRHYTHAAVKYRHAIDAGVETAHAWFRLGSSYFRSGRWREAERSLLKTRTFGGTREQVEGAFLRLEALQKLEDPASADQDKWIKSNLKAKDLGPRELMKQARGHLQKKEWEEAAKIFVLVPDDPDAAYYNAYCLRKLGREDALPAYERYLKLDDSDEKHVSWACCHVARHAEPDRAIEAAAEFRRRVAEPDIELAAWVRAYEIAARVTKGDLETAHRDFLLLQDRMRKARLTMEAPVHAATRLAEAFYEKKDYKRAAPLFRFVIRYGDVEITDTVAATIADCFIKAEDYGGALEFLPEIDSKDLSIECLRIRCLVKLGRLDEALRRVESNPPPEPPLLREIRADIYREMAMSLKRGSARVERLRKACEIYRDFAGLFRHDPDHYYRFLYKYYEALYHLDLDLLDQLFKFQEERGETFEDDAEYGPKILELREKLREKLPK
jgi:thioredoxin-like negative regulator of GroEL